jgi:predicted DNA-binding protein (UPF0251 family)
MTTRAEIEAKRREALRLHAAGVSKLAIGIQLGVSRKTVFNWLPPTHPRAERKVTRAELEALRCQQFTNIEIARQSGISRQRVAQILGPIPRPHREMKKVFVHIPDVEAIRDVAKSLGYRVAKGPYSGEGNISALLAAIADREVRVIKS